MLDEASFVAASRKAVFSALSRYLKGQLKSTCLSVSGNWKWLIGA
jgi:hypothetical protein